MARTLVGADTFDNYTDLSLFYVDPGSGAGIDLTGTKSRTGLGCLVLSQAFGPVRAVAPIRGNGLSYMQGTAYWQPGAEDSVGAGVIAFIDVDPGGSGDITFLLRVGVNASLGITVQDITGVVAISAPNLVVANSYNYIEIKCFFVAAGGGSAFVRLNGQTLTWATGGLTGITTLDPSRSSTGGECNQIRYGGPGGAANARHDDPYLYTSDQHNDSDFLGAVKNYAILPNANSLPLQWTPLAGTNFSEVNQVPPPGDASYVDTGTVGNTDQYVYDVSPVPPGLIVFGAVHLLDGKQASGSGSIGSSVNGIAAAGVPLGANYHFNVQQPYDTNPHTGLPWELTDFTSGTVIGPRLTA